MLLWVLPLALFLSALLYHLTATPKIRRSGQRLRRPPDTLPFFGNAIKFLQPRHVLFDWFVQCQIKFGLETFEIRVPTLPPGVVINDPKNLEFVLKHEVLITKGEFFKRRSWDLFGELGSRSNVLSLTEKGHGIINANGELWKAQRKAGLKFFSGANLDALIDEVLPEAYAVMKAQLLRYAEEESELDLQRLFLDLTTKVVGQMAYDMDMDASSPFSKAFDYASDQVGLRFQNPLYFVTEMFTGGKFQGALSEVKQFGRQIVASARKRRAVEAFESLVTNEKLVFGSLIDSLMEAFSNPTVVADAALNFLSAGRDTTAQSLTWTFYSLMRHPENADVLRKETDSVFSAKRTGADQNDIDTATLQPNSIPFTMAVFNEALRLYPPVPFEIKQCEADVTMPDGTFLPAGSVVVWCIWAMNRAQGIFGENTHHFDPRRWLDEQGRLIARSAFEFPVFNGGPRACLGKKMAELMAAYLIINLMRDFDFKEVEDGHQSGKERVTQNSLTLPMKDGLPCKVRKRNSRAAQ